jgi:dihydroneopterin aldolase
VDTLTLKAIQLKGKHGIYPSEREKGNHFELDVIFRGHFREAGEKDDLSLTPDYRAAVQIANDVISGPSQLLIESLCKKIGDRLFGRFPGVMQMEIALRKMAPALDTPAEYAEIRMQWQR